METPFDRLDEKRQPKSYMTLYGKEIIGTDELGNPILGKQLLPKMEYVDKDEVTGLIKTARFKSLYLSADRQGNKAIVTEFFLDQATETGYVPASASSILTHYTDPAEADIFFDQLFPMVERSVLNALAILLGHNTNRFFAPDGTPQNELVHQEKPNDRQLNEPGTTV